MLNDKDFNSITTNAQELLSLIRAIRTDNRVDLDKLELRVFRAATDIWELMELVKVMRQYVLDANETLNKIKNVNN